MSDSQAVEDIRRQMSQIRCDLSDDVQSLVAHAREMVDWRHYVRQYPLACAGVAAAVGYLVVPRRIHVMAPDAKALEELARKHRLVVGEPRPDQKSGLTGALFGMVSSLVMRGLLAYAGQQAGKLVGQQAADTTSPPGPTPQPTYAPFHKPR